MASARSKATETVCNVNLTTILRQRLRSEGMKDVKVNANSVDVLGGQLMATFMLSFPQSLPDDRRLKMEKIALEECASYLRTPRNPEISSTDENPLQRTTRTHETRCGPRAAVPVLLKAEVKTAAQFDEST
jgi:hypothetical protein